MKRFAALALCICMILCACGTPSQQPDPTKDADSTSPSTSPATTTAPQETESTQPLETVEATETEDTNPGEVVIYQHPLTGEALTAPFTVRPVAVVTNNVSVAQPLMGIGSADILFEHIAEGGGGITRMLAIYTDLEGAGQLGSIRSARTYLLDLARNFNAPIVHCGTSIYAEENIRSTKYPSFDEFKYNTYFYRDQARLDANYSKEHTLMIDSEDLITGLQENGFNMTADANAYYGMDFSENVDLNGASAQKITFQFFSQEGKRTYMDYNAEEGVYYGSQKWVTKVHEIFDGNTGASVPFKNVLILSVKVTYAEDKYHVFTAMTGEGTGYFACNGEYVPIKWYRESTSDPFTYTLEDGTPLVFGIGKTYVAMLPTRSPDVIFE